MTGFYTFKWDRPASEVYVTGTFDGWSRSTKLEKAESGFVKKVELPVENILYKFVVDGNWIVDPNAPVETEPSGVQNSVLFATNIEQAEAAMSQALMLSAAPEATTAVLAADVPKEAEEITIESAAPDSTTSVLAAEVTLELSTSETVEVAPVASEPEPEQEEEEEEEEEVFSVSPLPASETAENPITLQPDETVPEDIGSQSVKLDEESYENGAANFPIGSDYHSEFSSAVHPAKASETTIVGVEEPASEVPAAVKETAMEAEHPAVVVVTKRVEEEFHDVFVEASDVITKTTSAHDISQNVAPVSPTSAETSSLEYKDAVENHPETAVVATNGVAKPDHTPAVSHDHEFANEKKSSESAYETSLKKQKRRSFFSMIRDRFHFGRRS